MKFGLIVVIFLHFVSSTSSEKSDKKSEGVPDKTEGKEQAPLTSFGLLGRNFLRPSRDPSCPPDNSSYKTISSDGFYKKVTPDRIEILATTVSIDEQDIDPCKDFYLQATSLSLKGTLRWKGRNVYIVAVNLTVVDNETTIDVSYQSPGRPDYKLPAASGSQDGQAGSNGANGGVGQPSGNATLYIGFVFGGKLNIRAMGGEGGRGQDGGDGHEGAPGRPNSDRDACCHGRSTAGTRGGKGGDAGKPGESGNGGAGGYIKVLMLNKTWEDLQKDVRLAPPATGNTAGGSPGPQAALGKPGIGGPGGEGSGTHCYNAGHWYDHHWRCEGPYAPPGPRGPTGKPASSATPGKRGRNGVVSIGFGSLSEIAKYISKEMVQMTFREGNRYYKNGEFVSARNVYLWLWLTFDNSTNKELRGYAAKAKVFLQQIKHGLDYWAHAPNNMPLNSYNSIYFYLTNDIVPYAKDVEKDYYLYFKKTTTTEQKREIVRASVEHNKFALNILNKDLKDKLDELTEVKKELEELIRQHTDARAQVEGATAECKDAIEQDLIHKASAIHFSDLLKIAQAAIKIFASFEDGGLTLKSGLKDLIGALEAGEKLKGLDFFDELKELGTIVKNISGIYNQYKSKIVSDFDSIEKQYESIKDELDKAGKQNSQKIIVDGKEFDKHFDKWLYLPRCARVKPRFRTYLNLSQALNDKIMHHDATVIKVRSIQYETEVLQQENSRLQSELAEEFDPTLLSYMLAIRHVYFGLKDSVVDQMKRLQEAYNYQYLERRPFSYDDSRVVMIEAWLANNHISMLQKMEKIGNEVQLFNVGTQPLTNCLFISREDNPKSFEALDSTGMMPFVISGEEDQLSPLSNVHMIEVRVWLPGVTTSNGHLRVWLKRYGTSQVYDQQGQQWTFTHAPRTMLFDYDTRSLAANSRSQLSVLNPRPRYLDQNTKVQIEGESDYVALSPIGPWFLSVPPAYNPGVNTSQVRHICLQLGYTFLPCSDPQCPPRGRKIQYQIKETNSSKVGGYTKKSSSNATGSVESLLAVVIAVAVVLVVSLVAGFVVARRRKSHRRAHVQDGVVTERSPLVTNPSLQA